MKIRLKYIFFNLIYSMLLYILSYLHPLLKTFLRENENLSRINQVLFAKPTFILLVYTDYQKQTEIFDLVYGKLSWNYFSTSIYRLREKPIQFSDNLPFQQVGYLGTIVDNKQVVYITRISGCYSS